MRKWLLLIILVGIMILLTRLNQHRLHKRFPVLKRIDQTIKLAAWIIIIIYAVVVISWLI
jgi:hypothetical protein